MGESKAPFLKRVVLRNYKSIKHCDVTLGPLMFLVGPNGSGKSNFLDAIRFVSDSLRTTVRQAVEDRGEVRDILRATPEGRAEEFSIELSLSLPDGTDASYVLVVGEENGNFVVREEKCLIQVGGQPLAEFLVRDGDVVSASITPAPRFTGHQLFLTTVSGHPDFTELHVALAGMRFYNIDPKTIATEASGGKPARELMYHGGGALFTAHQIFPKAGVQDDSRKHYQDRIEQYLGAILGQPIQVQLKTDNARLVGEGGALFYRGEPSDEHNPQRLFFRFPVLSGEYKPVYFWASQMSDGTLRAFGVLLALFQCAVRPKSDPILLVGLEEPESALHPAAAGVLFDALREASHFTQVLVTTHSADLLDVKDVDSESLLVVESVGGESIIAQADEASKSIMRDRLCTAGELLRQNQLRPADLPSGSVGVGSDSQ